jgi:Holliday junction resolvase RusA-like endonuclease
MNLVFHIPKDEFFTKKGVIAKRHDLSNFCKYTEDVLARFLGFNDAFVVKITMTKIPADSWRISGYIKNHEEHLQ